MNPRAKHIDKEKNIGVRVRTLPDSTWLVDSLSIIEKLMSGFSV